MKLTEEKLSTSKIIFNHVPKTGGTSLIHLFRKLFRPNLCFRHKVRPPGTEEYGVAIEDVPQKELEGYRFIAGHFNFGNHIRFQSPTMYIGVMRDPFERIMSAYFHLKTKGRKRDKEIVDRLSFEKYAIRSLKKPKSTLAISSQMIYLTGQTTAEAAMAVIEEWYLACCTNEQLDDMQRMLARLYNRHDLAPLRLNVAEEPRRGMEISAETRATMQERFEEDYKLLAWVQQKFEQEYRDQTV